MINTKRLLLIFSFFSFSVSAYAGDGRLPLLFYYSKEFHEVDLSKKVDDAFFKCHETGKVHPIDPKLLELVDDIQDRFKARVVEVISAYRSPEFNKSLKDNGHKVGNESFHMRGMAMDIHLDEISEEAIRDYVRSLKRGGVGYYPALNMVHVDVGPVRNWDEITKRSNWIGEENKAVGFRIQVSPNILVGAIHEPPLLKMLIIGNAPQTLTLKDGQLEMFEKGNWKEVSDISLYGKYRYRFPLKNGESQFSNEFYYKRL